MGLGGARLAVVARGAPVALAPLVAQLVDFINRLDTAEVTGLGTITAVQAVTTVAINIHQIRLFIEVEKDFTKLRISLLT